MCVCVCARARARASVTTIQTFEKGYQERHAVARILAWNEPRAHAVHELLQYIYIYIYIFKSQ